LLTLVEDEIKIRPTILSVLTFCIVKTMEEASRYISNGTFDFMGWYINVLIIIIFMIGVFLLVKRDEGEK
jgi:hypothetical protein